MRLLSKDLSEKLTLVSHDIINEFNTKYRGKEDAEILIAMQTFFDLDMMFRVGKHFIDDPRTRFITYGKNGNQISCGDIEIQVRFWRNRSEKYDVPRPKSWRESFAPSHDWLIKSIVDGKKGKSLLVAIWCSREPWKYLHQFGTRKGANPPIANEKFTLIPFLKSGPSQTTDTIKTDYSKRNESYFLAEKGIEVNCILLGNEDDIVNMAVFF